jgi:hypothetical protein
LKASFSALLGMQKMILASCRPERVVAFLVMAPPSFLNFTSIFGLQKFKIEFFTSFQATLLKIKKKNRKKDG